MKYEGPALEVKLSMDYDGVGDPSDYTWLDITEFFDYSPGNFEWVESGKMSISQPNLFPGHYHFAFVYYSTNEAASSWEIGYVKVTAEATVSVNENQKASVSMYPNPAREQVSFVLEDTAQVSVFDMTGRKVNEMNVEAGQVQLNVSELENGVYFLNVRYANGTTAVTKFVKF